MTSKKLLAVLAAGLAVSGTALAQNSQDNQWHGNVAIGGAIANSNVSSKTFNAMANGVKESKEDKLGLYALANYGTSNTTVAGKDVTTKTADMFRLGGRYDYNMSETTFLFGGADYERNKIINIDSRLAGNIGAGVKVIRNADTAFDVFGGVGYSRTNFGAPAVPRTRKGTEFLLGEESSHKLSDTSTFKQRLVVYPGSSDVGTRATWDLGLATVVANGWTMNVGAAIAYNNKPSPGFKKTSSLVTFGFGYKY